MLTEYDRCGNRKITKKRKISLVIVLENGITLPYVLPDGICDDFCRTITKYSIMHNLGELRVTDVKFETFEDIEQIDPNKPMGRYCGKIQ